MILAVRFFSLDWQGIKNPVFLNLILSIFMVIIFFL